METVHIVIHRTTSLDPLVVEFADFDQATEFMNAANDLIWGIDSEWYVSAPAQPVSPASAARQVLAELARWSEIPSTLNLTFNRDALKRVKEFAVVED